MKASTFGSQASSSSCRLPKTGETIYRSFNFPQAWEQVRFEDVWVHPKPTDDLRLLAKLQDGKPVPLFPRIS